MAGSSPAMTNFIDFPAYTDYIPIAFSSRGRSREALLEEGRVRRPLFVVRSHEYREASGHRPRALRRAADPSLRGELCSLRLEWRPEVPKETSAWKVSEARS